MVYVKKDDTEEVTDSWTTTKGGVEFIIVETDNGYFRYKIPVVDAPDYVDGVEKVIDVGASGSEYIEAPESDHTSVYSGSDDIIIPEKVAREAEKLSGYPLLE